MYKPDKNVVDYEGDLSRDDLIVFLKENTGLSLFETVTEELWFNFVFYKKFIILVFLYIYYDNRDYFNI